MPRRRTKRVHYTTSLDESLLRELKVLAIREDCRQNELIEEAIELLFDHYGVPIPDESRKK